MSIHTKALTFFALITTLACGQPQSRQELLACNITQDLVDKGQISEWQVYDTYRDVYVRIYESENSNIRLDPDSLVLKPCL